MKADKKMAVEVELIEKILAVLEEGKCARTIDFTEKELEIVKDFNLLTDKPVIYVANVAEDEASSDGEGNDFVKQIKDFAQSENSQVVVISAKIEEDLSQLSDEEKKEFLSDMGMEYSGLEKLVKASYSLLGLISFLTTGEDETRAWTIINGTKAPVAAGKIHSDIQRGFIRAETISYEELVEIGGNMSVARDKGLIRSEGKDYVVKDGDVILFRFNV